MQDPPLNREYLQSLYYYRKNEIIRRSMHDIFEKNIRNLIEAASEGKLFYTFVLDVKSELFTHIAITKDELINLFQDKFPDCKITFEEFWLATLEKPIHQRCIRVDWS
jgi:hypothetical protein